jgi:hypothetical protein
MVDGIVIHHRRIVIVLDAKFTKTIQVYRYTIFKIVFILMLFWRPCALCNRKQSWKQLSKNNLASWRLCAKKTATHQAKCEKINLNYRKDILKIKIFVAIAAALRETKSLGVLLKNWGLYKKTKIVIGTFYRHVLTSHQYGDYPGHDVSNG